MSYSSYKTGFYTSKITPKIFPINEFSSNVCFALYPRLINVQAARLMKREVNANTQCCIVYSGISNRTSTLIYSVDFQSQCTIIAIGTCLEIQMGNIIKTCSVSFSGMYTLHSLKIIINHSIYRIKKMQRSRGELAKFHKKMDSSLSTHLLWNLP